MRTAAALVALLTVASVARAGEPAVVATSAVDFSYTPAYVVTPYARTHRSAASTAEIASGGTLLGATMVMGLTAIGYALSAAGNGLCGIDNGGAGCDAAYKRSDEYARTAKNLGIAAGLTALAGIPLLAVGVATGKHHDMRVSAAPLMSSTGGGASASFSMRF